MKTRKPTSTTTTQMPQTTPSSEGKRPVTTIEAKIDVGFGNQLFVRGEGAGLSWQHGLPLTCVDGKTWRWSGAVNDKLTFKLLLNDQVWAQGDNVEVKPGHRAEVSPMF